MRRIKLDKVVQHVQNRPRASLASGSNEYPKRELKNTQNQNCSRGRLRSNQEQKAPHRLGFTARTTLGAASRPVKITNSGGPILTASRHVYC